MEIQEPSIPQGRALLNEYCCIDVGGRKNGWRLWGHEKKKIVEIMEASSLVSVSIK